MKTPTVSLTQEQIDTFHRDGFLSIDAITTKEEVEFMKRIYDRLFEEKAGRDIGEQFDLASPDEDDKPPVLPQIHWPAKYAPELEDTQFRANATHIAKQLLGPEAVPQFEHAILKPAGYGAETPWHQDEAYWEHDLEYNTVSVWMPLQDATIENGCMQFIPGSHKGPIATHRSINNDPRIHGLEMVEPPDSSKAKACPIPAGGATFHTARTMHFTAANTTNQPRRAYILLFNTPPVPCEPRNFFWNAEKKTAGRERAKAANVKRHGAA